MTLLSKLLVSVSVITACGGGGGSSETTNTPISAATPTPTLVPTPLPPATGTLPTPSPTLPLPTPTPIAPITPGNVYISGVKINLSTGAFTPQGTSKCDIQAITVDLDGIAIVSGNNAIFKFDPVSGNCLKLFNIPEAVQQIAIAPDGTLSALSKIATFGAKQIYRFSPKGEVLSKIPLVGWGQFGDLSTLSYDKAGHLFSYGYNVLKLQGGLFEIDQFTGITTLVSDKLQKLGFSIGAYCIDNAGDLYVNNFGVLSKHDTKTGNLIFSLTLQSSLYISPIICR